MSVGVYPATVVETNSELMQYNCYHTLDHLVMNLPTTRISSKLLSTLADAICAIVVVPCCRVRRYGMV